MNGLGKSHRSEKTVGSWHKHGSPALMAYMAAAPHSVKANVRSSFKQSCLNSDRKTLDARQSLAQQVLAKNTSLSSYETAVSRAQLKVIQDEDALVQSVCGQLSASQLSAATTLYSNLQSNHQTVRGYLAAAHQAKLQRRELIKRTSRR